MAYKYVVHDYKKINFLTLISNNIIEFLKERSQLVIDMDFDRKKLSLYVGLAERNPTLYSS